MIWLCHWPDEALWQTTIPIEVGFGIGACGIILNVYHDAWYCSIMILLQLDHLVIVVILELEVE